MGMAFYMDGWRGWHVCVFCTFSCTGGGVFLLRLRTHLSTGVLSVRVRDTYSSVGLYPCYSASKVRYPVGLLLLLLLLRLRLPVLLVARVDVM